MRYSRWIVSGFALALLTCASQSTLAQSLAPADAKAFMGKWNIAADGPMGPINMALTVSEEAGKVVAEVGGGDLPVTKVTDVSKTGNDLVLKYLLDIQGMSIPAKLTLTPDGEKLKVVLDFAEGAFSAPGAATKGA